MDNLKLCCRIVHVEGSGISADISVKRNDNQCHAVVVPRIEGWKYQWDLLARFNLKFLPQK